MSRAVVDVHSHVVHAVLVGVRRWKCALVMAMWKQDIACVLISFCRCWIVGALQMDLYLETNGILYEYYLSTF